jgi:polyisoprenoid-binding protein YceI
MALHRRLRVAAMTLVSFRSLFALAAAALAAGVGAAAHAEAVTYVLDPSHTQVTFEVLHLGTSTLRGRFNRIEGHATLDRAARKGELSVAIDTASVSTGVLPLDGLLRGTQGFSSPEHPKAYFVAQQLGFDGDKLVSVRGEFTLRGTGQPLTLRATGFNCYPHPELKREVCGGDFEAELKRSSFGINHSLPFVGDRVRLLIQVEGVRQ